MTFCSACTPFTPTSPNPPQNTYTGAHSWQEKSTWKQSLLNWAAATTAAATAFVLYTTYGRRLYHRGWLPVSPWEVVNVKGQKGDAACC